MRVDHNQETGMPNNKLDTLKQINRSGFPFQLRVENEIRSSQNAHGWSVASHEHPWAAYDESGFIDIVVEHDQFVTFRVVIECKRIRQTMQDSSDGYS